MAGGQTSALESVRNSLADRFHISIKKPTINRIKKELQRGNPALWTTFLESNSVWSEFTTHAKGLPADQCNLPWPSSGSPAASVPESFTASWLSPGGPSLTTTSLEDLFPFPALLPCANISSHVLSNTSDPLNVQDLFLTGPLDDSSSSTPLSDDAAVLSSVEFLTGPYDTPTITTYDHTTYGEDFIMGENTSAVSFHNFQVSSQLLDAHARRIRKLFSDSITRSPLTTKFLTTTR